jgi:hypothetical protein
VPPPCSHHLPRFRYRDPQLRASSSCDASLSPPSRCSITGVLSPRLNLVTCSGDNHLYRGREASDVSATCLVMGGDKGLRQRQGYATAAEWRCAVELTPDWAITCAACRRGVSMQEVKSRSRLSTGVLLLPPSPLCSVHR